MAQSDEPRWILIRHLRSQIAAGTYVTTGKLRIAVAKLLRECDREHGKKVEGNFDRKL